MMEKFHYTLPDGYEIEIPKIENVPLGVMRKTRRLEASDKAFTMLEELITDEVAWEHLDKLHSHEFEKIMKAWREASAVTTGESSASSS